jgi:hypothetical protein
LEKSWTKRHPVASTILVIILIAAIFTGLKFLQEKYFPAQPKEIREPIFVNETFEQVNQYFTIGSNLTDKEQDQLFSERYKYNIFRWHCQTLSCQKLVGKPTLKLICSEQAFTEDVRIVMQENCTKPLPYEVTVLFQLVSKTTGDYYLGRSGMIVE